ncbi:hypothetical protein FV228_03595 [Methylobacterium sp. WL18]|uniref:hypothetical protein n=1 Tax=Methylobacterium sp. WL18 TaxID=2603897 RepID=UPI0011CBD1F1|nr:hypothetical protein [Methylobacterium sp. WL18]TXN75517.1 hypothetical protein FV228_03595 [Methylobacterium sp. WL18]
MQIARALCVEPGFWFVGAPNGVFEPSPPIDTGNIGNGDTRRLLHAWSANAGEPRKHFLHLALALAQQRRLL